MCTSEGADVCRQCCEFLMMMMQLWPTQTLERHVATLQDSIKRCISDPDPDARSLSRKYAAILTSPYYSRYYYYYTTF